VEAEENERPMMHAKLAARIDRKPAHHELWVEKSTRLPSGTADTSFDLTGLSLSICAILREVLR